MLPKYRQKRISQLPKEYYLSHFKDFLQDISLKYLGYLNDEEKQTLEKLQTINRESLKLFVRLHNRKGYLFDINGLNYDEIENIEASCRDLLNSNLLRTPEPRDLQNLIKCETKERLFDILDRKFSKRIRRSYKKSALVQLACETLNIEYLTSGKKYVAITHPEHLQYFTFLSFGRIEDNLSRFTMRDLGLRKTNHLASSKSTRFSSEPEARNIFFFNQLNRLGVKEKAQWVLESTQGDKNSLPPPMGIRSQNLRNQLLLEASHYLISNSQLNEAIDVLKMGNGFEIFKAQINTLSKSGKKKQAIDLCQGAATTSDCIDTLLFCENFLNRKVKGSKRNLRTDFLTESKTIQIEGLNKPEAHAKKYFENLGYLCFRSENYFWRSLFGILFWEELFAEKNSSIHSEFDFLPSVLKTNRFYPLLEDDIEKKLGKLSDLNWMKKYILRTVAEHYGTKNGVFKWHPSTAEILLSASECIQFPNFAPLLRMMCKDFLNNKSGYPDLLLIKEKNIKFVEVKSEGDKISPKQFRQIRLFNDLGIKTEVLKTQWLPNDNQVYSVVDVETTGGRKNGHRITEIGVVKIQNGKEIDRFSTLINPERPIPKNITKLTGINDNMVASAPRFSEVADKLYDFLEGTTFCAHFVEFDYGFISMEFEKVGIKLKLPKLCTCASMRRYFKGYKSYSLKNLCTAFNIPLLNHHRALDDATAAAQLLKLVLERKSAREIGESEIDFFELGQPV